VGLIALEDIETEERLFLNTGAQKKVVDGILQERLRAQNLLWRKHKVDLLDIYMQQDFLPIVVNFFERRMMY